MSKKAKEKSSFLVDAALFVCGLLLIALLYGLAVRLFTPRVDPRREDNPAELVGEIIQIEVRNGCGVTGLAADATSFLRRRGFDVVEVGDYDHFNQEHSLVIDRVGDLEAAKKVAEAMGIDEKYVAQEIRLDYYLDASVVLGKDYAGLIPFKE